MPPELLNKRLYIIDLAQRLLAMECGSTPMHALAYRLLARRLHQAAAGLPDAALRQAFETLGSASAALLGDTLQVRHFDQHGWLPGPQAAACQAAWLALQGRLRLPRA